MRTIGHLAAAEGHLELLEYLAKHSKFNFELEDRWGTKILDELKNLADKVKIEKILMQRKPVSPPRSPAKTPDRSRLSSSFASPK